jgi:hypothetical protein
LSHKVYVLQKRRKFFKLLAALRVVAADSTI